MYYNFSRRELREKKGTDFKDGDTINITDSHYEIWIKYGDYPKPGLCSRVYDINKSKFQDVAFRQDYISNFLRR